MGRARLAVTDGESVIVGLRKLKEEMTFGKYGRPRRPGWAERMRVACGRKGGAVGLAGLRGRMGRLAAGPKLKEKFFSE
jgi:hypothetical protein